MNKFLPKDYNLNEALPKTEGGQYMKFKEEGEYTFRVLDSAIIGYQYWTHENKPVRTRKLPPKEEVKNKSKDGKVKHFWAFPVYNYNEKKIQILELTQRSIMTSIEEYIKEEDYGLPQNYDIKVIRDDSKDIVQYKVVAKVPKTLDENIKKEYEKTNINLEKLYEGENPFENNEKNDKESMPEIDF